MEQYIDGGELNHHGIKGMRWGVRRFQKEDGSLTPAGKKRYSDDSDTATVTKEKSKHRTKLEERYKKEGMSDAEATAAANKRIRTEKILAGIAGVTVAAAGTYLVTKAVRERTDQLIKSGSKFQRIEGTKKIFGKDRNLHDSFYVTDNKYDNKNYQDAFGYIKKTKYGEAYKLDIEAKKDIKIASQHQAKKVLEDLLYNDERFRDNLYEGLVTRDMRGEHPVSFENIKKITQKKPISSRTMKRMYENFNTNLVNQPQDYREATTRRIFYDALKKKGYSGIQDINDLKFSKLRGKNPLIIFDKSKVSVTKVEDILDKVSATSTVQAYSRMNRLRGSQAVAKSLPAIATMSVGAATSYYMRGTKASTKNAAKNEVRRYRKEHPNSKLTDREIMAMYNKK